jgi:hypothetical protein
MLRMTLTATTLRGGPKDGECYQFRPDQWFMGFASLPSPPSLNHVSEDAVVSRVEYITHLYDRDGRYHGVVDNNDYRLNIPSR